MIERTHRGSAKVRASTDLTNVRSVGRFELIRAIARGGMGQVYLARDPNLGRRVAIKFLLNDDPQFVQRFLIEARATARCTHENIVTIYEVGEHAGQPYMVLEYLEGKTLAELIEAGLPLQRLVEIMIDVARALERAHEHHIVHRDLKPANIIVTARGQVKVLDFGVARFDERLEKSIARVTAAMEVATVDSSTGFTEAGSYVGTYAFMSPEQWGASAVDSRSDLWAFGIILWCALSGTHPCGALSPEQLHFHLRDIDRPVPSIGTELPELPPHLVAIVDRCVQKDPALRYQSASDLLADLNALVAPKAARAADVAPYLGLAAYGEDDAQYFFGRINEVRSASAQLDTWPILAVVGPSGVGKSSFIRAGLLPAVRAIGGPCLVRMLRPGNAPLERLATLLDEVTGTTEPADRLLQAPGVFGMGLRAAATRHHRITIVVDQLEELFTLCKDDYARHAFLEALLGAADDPSAPVRVILSMRADFLDRLAAHPRFLAEVSRGLFFLSSPQRENLREALVLPAQLAGYAFEDPWIVEDMLHVATRSGALPLLSFAALQLWDARDRTRRLLTVEAYRAMGGVAGAFSGHADHVIAAIAPQHQQLLRAILTRLVTPDGTRAIESVAELTTLAPQQIEPIIDHLVRGRLVHMQQEPGHGATIELVHEMLITHWPALRQWLQDKHAVRAFADELRQAARQWASRQRPRELVWRDAMAHEAIGHVERSALQLSTIESEFLTAIRAEIARARRRKLGVIGAIVAALALVLVGGTVALVRIKLAERDAQAEARAAESALAESRSAKADLQKQLDVVREKEAARVEARRLADQAVSAEKLTREQLVEINEQLSTQILEVQRAEQRARLATTRVEELLAKERAARAKLEAKKRRIYNEALK